LNRIFNLSSVFFGFKRAPVLKAAHLCRLIMKKRYIRIKVAAMLTITHNKADNLRFLVLS